MKDSHNTDYIQEKWIRGKNLKKKTRPKMWSWTKWKKGWRSVKRNSIIIITTLTLRTSLAWNSGVQLWWMKPMPPVSWEEAKHQCVCEWATWCVNTTAGTRKLSKETVFLCVTLTAIAMAMLASVTVSMGEETKGVFIVICLVSAEVRSWTEDISSIRRTFPSSFQQNLQSYFKLKIRGSTIN